MPHWLKRLLSLSPAPASKQGSLNYNHPQGRHVGPFHSLTIVTHNKEHLKRVIRLLINHSICETICHNSQHIVWFLKIPYFLLPYLFSSFFFFWCLHFIWLIKGFLGPIISEHICNISFYYTHTRIVGKWSVTIEMWQTHRMRVNIDSTSFTILICQAIAWYWYEMKHLGS